MRIDIIATGLISLALFACSEDSTNPVSGNSSQAISSNSSSSATSSVASSSSSSQQSSGTPLLDARTIDQYGFWGSAVLAPDADFGSGGSSEVLSPTGVHLGGCALGDNACKAEWNIASSLGDGSVSSTLKITDYVPSSKALWGWASAGWVLIPKPTSKPTDGQTWLDVAGPIGLTSTQSLVIDLQYTKGEKLTLELGSDEVKSATADGSSAPPRSIITGTGARTTIKIPISTIKPATWSAIKSYDASKYTNIKLLRIIASANKNEAFPATEVSKRPELKLYGISVE